MVTDLTLAVECGHMTVEKSSAVAAGPDAPSKTSSVPPVASLGAAAVGIFALMKVYAAAGFSLTTASALLTTAPLNVLLGSLVSFSYELFPLLALGALAWLVHLVRSHGWGIDCTAVAGFSVLAILLSPWADLWPPTLVLIGTLLVHIFLVRVFRIREANWRLLSNLVGGFFVLMALKMILTTLPQLWLPVEAISVAADTGPQLVVGHVLTADSEWTSIVRAGDKALMRIPSSAVKNRKLCHLSGVQPDGRRPVLWVILRHRYQSPNRSCIREVSDTPGVLEPGSLPPTDRALRTQIGLS
jgi:hypothetical protein